MIRIDGRASYRFQVDLGMTEGEFDDLTYSEKEEAIAEAIGDQHPLSLDYGDDDYSIDNVYTHS